MGSAGFTTEAPAAGWRLVCASASPAATRLHDMPACCTILDRVYVHSDVTPLGQGNQGQVCKAQVLNAKTGKTATLAVKEAAPHTSGSGLLREAVALSHIHASHGGKAPHVVPLTGIIAHHHLHTPPSKPPCSAGLRTGHVQALIMPVFEAGDLFSFLQTPGLTLTRTQRWLLIEQLLTGLTAAKAAGVAHCDVKPHNVLRHSNGDVFITDFGLSVSHMTPSTRCARAHGSPLYMAPEALECLRAGSGGGAEPYDPYPADVWSLGITLTQIALPRLWHACLRGSSSAGWPDMRDRVLAAVRSVCEPRLGQMVARALTLRPAQRATLEELQLVAALGAAEARAAAAAAAAAELGAGVATAEAHLNAYYRGEPVGCPLAGGGAWWEWPLEEDKVLWGKEEALVRQAERLFPPAAGRRPLGRGHNLVWQGRPASVAAPSRPWPAPLHASPPAIPPPHTPGASARTSQLSHRLQHASTLELPTGALELPTAAHELPTGGSSSTPAMSAYAVPRVSRASSGTAQHGTAQHTGAAAWTPAGLVSLGNLLEGPPSDVSTGGGRTATASGGMGRSGSGCMGRSASGCMGRSSSGCTGRSASGCMGRSASGCMGRSGSNATCFTGGSSVLHAWPNPAKPNAADLPMPGGRSLSSQLGSAAAAARMHAASPEEPLGKGPLPSLRQLSTEITMMAQNLTRAKHGTAQHGAAQPRRPVLPGSAHAAAGPACTRPRRAHSHTLGARTLGQLADVSAGLHTATPQHSADLAMHLRLEGCLVHGDRCAQFQSATAWPPQHDSGSAKGAAQHACGGALACLKRARDEGAFDCDSAAPMGGRQRFLRAPARGCSG